MTIDEFVKFISSLSYYVLPIVGVIFLIYLTIFICNLIKLIKSINQKVKDLDCTLNLVNKNLEIFETTNRSIANVSSTIADVHEKMKSKAVTTAKSVMSAINKKKAKKGEKIYETNDDL